MTSTDVAGASDVRCIEVTERPTVVMVVMAGTELLASAVMTDSVTSAGFETGTSDGTGTPAAFVVGAAFLSRRVWTRPPRRRR